MSEIIQPYGHAMQFFSEEPFLYTHTHPQNEKGSTVLSPTHTQLLCSGFPGRAPCLGPYFLNYWSAISNLSAGHHTTKLSLGREKSSEQNSNWSGCSGVNPWIPHDSKYKGLSLHPDGCSEDFTEEKTLQNSPSFHSHITPANSRKWQTSNLQKMAKCYEWLLIFLPFLPSAWPLY